MNFPATELFEEILKSGAGLRVRVTGRSMTPFIRNGEVVTLQQMPVTALHIGDVILVKMQRGDLLLHRIVKKTQAAAGVIFRTKGDALTLLDEPISGEDILAKVLRIEKTSPGNGLKRIVRVDSFKMQVLNYLCAKVLLTKARVFSLVANSCKCYVNYSSR